MFTKGVYAIPRGLNAIVLYNGGKHFRMGACHIVTVKMNHVEFEN